MLVRILIVATVVLFLFLWGRAMVDVLRRPDLSTGAKVAWGVGMLAFPFAGLLLYVMLRPADAQIEATRRP